MLVTSQENVTLLDELNRCIAKGIINIGNSTALEWWTKTAQRTRFPTLSRMAIDILSIPAMFSEVKRLFSAAKLTISEKCHWLRASTIEVVECLKL